MGESKALRPMPRVPLQRVNKRRLLRPRGAASTRVPGLGGADRLPQPPEMVLPVSLELAKASSVIEWYRTCALLAKMTDGL